jgi:hypothetical protein
MSSSSSDSSSSTESDSFPRFLGLDDAFEFKYTFDPALVTLMPDPPPERSAIPVRPTTILTPPSDGFFVLATCIFHAEIVPEGTVIRTKPCPSNLHIIAKNNLGYPDGKHRRFMEIMPTIMRNNKTAEDILKESMTTCLSELNSTCKAFEAAPAPKKMKSEVKLKCSELKNRIKDIGVHGLTELQTPKTQTEQLAVLFNAHEKGNELTNVVYFGTMLALNDSFLDKKDRLNVERLMCQNSCIDYGVPQKRYIPGKTFYLNMPIDFMRTGDALDDFIDNLYCHLHLAVGLRLDGASYTVQLNVDLRALKASDPTSPNTITLDEVVKLLVSPTLSRRVVDLVCEKHPALTLDEKKEVLIRLSANADTWQVGLLAKGCSDIHVEGYPELLYIGPEHKTTKKKKRKVVVLSAPAHGSRPPRTQTIRLKKMEQYITDKKSDDVFTTLMRKRKRSDSSSNSSSSNETIEPSTPKQHFSDYSSGGSKRRQCKRRTQRRTQRRHHCKRTLN